MSLKSRLDTVQSRINQVTAGEEMLIFTNFQRKEDLKVLLGTGGPYHRKPGESFTDFKTRAMDGARLTAPFGAFPLLMSGGADVDA